VKGSSFFLDLRTLLKKIYISHMMASTLFKWHMRAGTSTNPASAMVLGAACRLLSGSVPRA